MGYQIKIAILVLLSLINVKANELNSQQWVEKALSDFQGYCYNTNADYKKIEDLVKVLNLKQIDDKFKALFMAPGSQKAQAYFLHVNKATNDSLVLSFSVPNACTIASVKGNIKDLFITQAVKYFKLKLVARNDIGVQVMDIYIPNGKLGTKEEMNEKGAILFSYFKTKSLSDTFMMAYMPPNTIKSTFK